MGRAERRRMERSDRIENRKGKLLMSKSDLKDIRAEISENNVQILMTCFALANHRLYGHGQKRTLRTLTEVDRMMGEILDGTKTMDDFTRELREECEIEVKF